MKRIKKTMFLALGLCVATHLLGAVAIGSGSPISGESAVVLDTGLEEVKNLCQEILSGITDLKKIFDLSDDNESKD